MNNRRKFIVAFGTAIQLFAVAVGWLPIPAFAQSYLNAEEVRTLIAANTVEAQRMDGTRFRAFFESGGKWMREDRGRINDGTWRIMDDGTQCTTPHGGADETCALIQKNDDGTYTRVENGKPRIRWLKISPGKTF